MVQSQGTWHGDDDFASVESSYRGNADLSLSPSISAGAHAMFSNSPNPGGNNIGGNYNEYFGGGRHGGNQSGGGGGGNVITCIPASGTWTAQCGNLLAVLGAAVLLSISAGIGGLVVCIVGGALVPLTAGTSAAALCWAAIFGNLGSSVALGAAWNAYTGANCPVPEICAAAG